MGCFSNMRVEEVDRLFDNPSRLAMEHIPFSKQFHESDNASFFDDNGKLVRWEKHN